jgi:UDP-glucose 4-epimerase
VSVLVLGASGFLGRRITEALQVSGHDVTTVGRSGVMDVVVDAVNTGSLESVLRSVAPTSVINLLGAGLSDPNADVQVMEAVNTQFPVGLANLLARVAPNSHLIHAASSTETPAADGSYESEYSRTKAAGTAALESTEVGLPITLLRVHNTYGGDQPAQRFVASVVDSLANERNIELRYPERVRDFIHVDDVANAFVAALGTSVDGNMTYEVGTAVGTSLASVVRVVASIMDISSSLTLAESVKDLHPRTVASQDSLLRPATIDLQTGLKITASERLQRGEGT